MCFNVLQTSCSCAFLGEYGIVPLCVVDVLILVMCVCVGGGRGANYVDCCCCKSLRKENLISAVD